MSLRLALAALALTTAAPARSATPDQIPPWPADPSKPIYVTSHVDVKSENTATAVAALRAYVAASRREPGLVRIEAVQEPRQNHFDLIEVWKDWAAFQAHSKSPGAIAFHDLIHPLRGSPFEERLSSLIAP